MVVEKGYKQTEVGVIPRDWSIITIGDSFQFIGGSQPPRSTFVFTTRPNYIRLIQIRDYKSEKFETYIPEILANKKCSKDDIMIGRYGPPIFQILKGIEGAYNVALIKALPEKILNKSFAYYFLTQNILFEFVEKLSQRSSGQTGVDLMQLKLYKFPLPPLPEQTAIANALSDMDALIAQTEKLIEKKKAIKQGVMQELLKPKEGWVTKKLGEVCTVIKSGGTPLTSNSEFYNGEIPFLSIGDMTSQGKNIRFTTSHITKLGLDNSASWIVPKDSIIYSMYASVGFVSINRTEIAISQAVLGIRFRDDINFEFMYYMLTSMQKQVLKFVGEGTQKNLNARTVKDFDIQLPSYKTQIEIAEILCEIDNNIFSLETKLEKLKQQKQGMMQALLTGKIRLI